MSADWLEAVRWTADGLVPVIVQEKDSGQVLMFAWMNRESLAETVATGRAVYWSRSRRRLWRKGEESGHVQRVCDIRLDCDHDVLLLTVEQVGGIACHTGRHHCFFQRLQDGQWQVVEPVLKPPEEIYAQQPGAPVPDVPTQPEGQAAPAPAPAPVRAPQDRDAAAAADDHGAHTVLERLASVLQARKSASPERSYVARLYARGLDAILKKIGEEAMETALAAKDGDAQHLVHELADLWFHSLVLLIHAGLGPQAVLAELQRRFGTSGLEEKRARTAGG